MDFVIGLVVNLVCGLLAYWKKTVSVSGLWSGIVIGTLLYGWSGPQGFCLLVFFFILASLFTRQGSRRKKAMGIAQPHEGRRGAREALANCLPGLFFAFLYWRERGPLFQIGLVSSFAAALADTTATELGQLYGRRFFRIPGFQRVPIGTTGACSLEGTWFGILAAAAMGTLGWLLGFLPFIGIAWVTLGATAGFLGESLISHILLNHEARNFMGSLLGGIFGILFMRIFS